MHRPTHTHLVQMVTSCKKCMRLIKEYEMSKLGQITSEAKATASRENGKLGGRPRKYKCTKDPNTCKVAFCDFPKCLASVVE